MMEEQRQPWGSLTGVVIDKWTLLECLGQGGMSVVYRARHRWLEQTAAIKLLLPDRSNITSAYQRFLQEARYVSRLQHPNIIQIKDFGKDKIYGFFMILELLEGQELAHYMERAPLPLTWLVGVVEQICGALQAVHDHGLVHRDLKPSNIFLMSYEPSHTPQVKLLDFGVARSLCSEDLNLTATGSIVGTPRYLAPEQIRTPKKVTYKADIYALGVLLFEALTGSSALFREDVMEQIMLVTQEAAPRLGTLRSELAGSQLEDLLAQMLAKDPARRPTSASEVWQTFKLAALPWIDLNPTSRPENSIANKELPSGEETSLSPPENVHQEPDISGNTLPLQEVATSSQPLLQANVATPQPAPQAHIDTPSRDAATTVPAKSAGHWAWLAGAGLLVVALLGWQLWPYGTVPSMRVSRPSVSASRSSSATLTRQVAAGKQAFQRKQYKRAIQHWKAVVNQPGWRQSSYYPKLYRALGTAYVQQQCLSCAVRYYQRYQKAVTQEYQHIKRLKTRWQQARQQPLLDQVKWRRKRLPSPQTFAREVRQIAALQSQLQARQQTQQRQIAQQLQSLQKLRRKTEDAVIRRRWKQAQEYARRYRKQWKQLQPAAASKFTAQQKTRVATALRWMRQIPRLKQLQRKAAFFTSQARFAKAQQQWDTLLSLVQDTPMLQVFQKRHRQQQQQAQHAIRWLRRADRAYRRVRWRKAYQYYKLYLKGYPHAWDRTKWKRRAKTCRCVFGPLPWESCEARHFPPHYRR